jgi:hypothetical protein
VADIKRYLQIKKNLESDQVKDIHLDKNSNVLEGNSKFLKIVPEEEPEEDEYESKIQKHKRKAVIIILAIAVCVIGAAAFAVYQLGNMEYSGYTIVKSINKEDTETAGYIDYNGGYIRYSNDGISYYTKKGTSLWNQTYQMSNPQVKICGESVAVGDINGSSIYVLNESGMIGIIDTSLTITQIEVASQGVVAAVLEDVNANYINLYGTDGEKVYSVKTTLEGDGYPINIGISEDATKLIASYVYVNGDSTKNKVVFYNFSEVGKNETERIVGGFNHYDSIIVPEVKFVSETRAIAIGENVISIYAIKEYPSLEKEIEIESEIERIFTSDEYIGVVLKGNDSGNAYQLIIYDIEGDVVCQTTINTEYKGIKFDGESVIMYNDRLFTLMNLRGKIQLEQDFDLPVEEVLSLGSKGNYMIINSKYIQEIKLK